MRSIVHAASIWSFLALLSPDPSCSFVVPRNVKAAVANKPWALLNGKTICMPISPRNTLYSPSTFRSPLCSQYRTTTALQLAAPSAAVALAVAALQQLGSVLVLALIVLVHEAGHYLAAKSFGITVEEFSVGVGPKLFGFEAGNDEFNVRALPLGGYVRFPENYNATLAREVEIEQVNKEKKSKKVETLQQASPIVDSSSFMKQIVNFVSFGQPEQQKRSMQQEEEQRRLEEELEQKKRPFWKRFIVAPSTASTRPKSKSSRTIAKTRESDEIEIEYYDDPNLLQNRPWTQRAVVLSMGVIFNLILSYMLCFGEIKWSANGLPQAVFEPGAVVSSIRSDSVSRGLLQPGDVIVGINGYPIALSDSRNAMAAQQSISDLISRIRETPDGGSVQLSVVRSLTSSSTSILSKPVSVKVQPKPVIGGQGPQSIGVMLSPNFVKTARLQSDSWIEASQMAAKYVAEITSETASGLGGFFGRMAKGQGAPAGQQISGPIGLIRTGSEVVATKDWNSVVIFAAIISINLAVVNSLPLPALDGGQLVFVLAEAFTGRKVDQRLQESITSVAVLVLLLATASFAVGDVQNLIGR